MSVNDSLFNNKKHTTNSIKLRHMFQNEDEEGIKQESNEFDIEEQYQKNKAKIAKKFNIDNEKEFNETTLHSLKQLLHLNSYKPTQSIYDFIEEIKQENEAKLNEITINEQIEPNNKKENVDNININDLIITSEKDIFNSTDQKSILQNLINDINSNSMDNNNYDNELFEKNIDEMIKETQDEIDLKNVEKSSDEEIEEDYNRTSILPFLFIVCIILLGIAGYLYRDIIFNIDFKEILKYFTDKF